MTEDQREGFLSQVDTFRFVAGVAFLASMVLVIFSIYLYSELNKTVDRLDGVVQARLKEAEASDRAAVQRCYSSATQGPALRLALRGLEAETADPQTREALANLRRTSELNSPTLADCRLLAKRLGVPTPRRTVR